jgi:tetratricopeptide (TPR) repeat protein
MLLSTHALSAAACALQQISDSTPGERGRRAAVVVLVLRSVERAVEEGGASEFVRRRAEAELDRLPSGAERSLLRRLLMLLVEEVDGQGLIDVLVQYAAGLEDSRRLPEADAVLTLARALDPESADLALRAGRLARLQGDRERALELYGTARKLDRDDGSVGRLAAVGEAVVAAEPLSALSVAIRRAVRAGDAEAAAVGLEERARERRSRGDRGGAVRDFAMAAARFTDSVDRARVAHQIADLFVAADDPSAAREALLFALATGDRTQREHAQSRLHTVSRDLSDEVGMRRWRSFKAPTLVSLSSRPKAAREDTVAPRMARWRERVERLVSSAVPA